MSEHISSVKLYVGIWLALMAGTILTVVVAGIDLGPLNPVMALAIATTKAVLVVLFFMHVKYAHEKLTKLVIVTAIFFFLILLALTMADYTTRLWT
ncbi:MAG TPA: cytochrome C oxidase subunit IV family protein [Terriglobales bacterium]|jgi:cytochrome c oxidase subunit IV|nr:cytochrome C oxidase subunit IV family protein [Terriglobales bacterium]